MENTIGRIYGINPVFEAVRAARRDMHKVWLNRDGSANPRLRKLACEIPPAAHTSQVPDLTNRQEIVRIDIVDDEIPS